MTKPALSITVLNYNYGHYLPRCLDSILTQTFTDFEVILIDDCSTDASSEVIRPYLADPRLRFFPHAANAGFARSLIEGTEQYSRGDILTVISADDFVLENDAFEKQMALLASDEVALCFSGGALVFEDGRRNPYRSLPETRILERQEAFSRFLFDKSFWAMHSGAMFRRSAYERSGGYRRDIAMPLDLALFLKVCLEGKTAYCNEELYGYGIHGGQMSTSKLRQNAVEVCRIIDVAVQDGARLFGMNPSDVRRRGIQRQLYPILISESHTGRGAAGFGAIAAWLRVAPIPTLTSRSMWIALSRLLLGKHGSNGLRTLRRWLKPAHDRGLRLKEPA